MVMEVLAQLILAVVEVRVDIQLQVQQEVVAVQV